MIYDTILYKLADPSTLPSIVGYGCAYNNNDTRLAVTCTLTKPIYNIYTIQRQHHIPKLANPSTLPSGIGGCAYNNDGTRLAVAHQQAHVYNDI